MIGGNYTVELQTKSTTKNDIGEDVISWKTVQTLFGFLDLMSNNNGYNYQTRFDESTHVFVCDYTPLNLPNDLRMKCSKGTFDVQYIDDPMELHEHLEIFLKRVDD